MLASFIADVDGFTRTYTISWLCPWTVVYSLMFHKSLIASKAYQLAIDVTNLYYDVLQPNRDFDIGKQILKSATSISANLQEAYGAYSRKEFKSKLSIAYKECLETEFWLNLLLDSGRIQIESFTELNRIHSEVGKMLNKALRSLDTENKPAK